MSMINDGSSTGPPSTSSRRSSFLDCFGHSGEKMQLEDNVNSVSRRRRRRRISEWSFSCKKSTVVKRVHVDPKSKSVNNSPAKSDTTREIIQVVEEDATLAKKHVIMVDANNNNINTQIRKNWTDIVKRQNGSFRSRRKETKPAATSATGAGLDSPEKKTVTIAQPFVSTPLKPLTHSKSLPARNKQKPPKAPSAGGGIDEGVLHKKSKSGGEFDSIIAMSILLAILVIMMLWGKLCAIFCTCAWFIIAPRVVAAGGRSAVAETERRSPESVNNVNLESVEYKKKVVLEGLLQRNHRINVVGRL